MGNLTFRICPFLSLSSYPHCSNLYCCVWTYPLHFHLISALHHASAMFFFTALLMTEKGLLKVQDIIFFCVTCTVLILLWTSEPYTSTCVPCLQYDHQSSVNHLTGSVAQVCNPFGYQLVEKVSWLSLLYIMWKGVHFGEQCFL